MTTSDTSARDASVPSTDPELGVCLHVRDVRGQGADAEFVLLPGQPSVELDAFLEARGAETIVFLPLLVPRKVWKKKRKRKVLPSSGKDLEKRRAKLGPGTWGEGELVRQGDPELPIPAAWQLDLRRYRGRLVAESLGLKHFYWACRGAGLEVHQVEPFSDEDTFELDAVRALARQGLHNMGQAAAGLDRLADATRAVGSDPRHLGRIAALVIGLTFAVCLLLVTGVATPDPSSAPNLRRAFDGLTLLAHPFVLPAILLGGYLRRHLAADRGADPTSVRRELSREECSQAWHATNPHLLATWILVGFGVVQLTIGRLSAQGDFGPVELVDEVTTNCLVALWILTPLTYARDLSSAIGSCVEAAITVFVSLFVLKITMFCTNIAVDLSWSAMAWLCPFQIPVWIRRPFEIVTSISAELFFFTILLGYTWAKAREHFGRWATLRSPRIAA